MIQCVSFSIILDRVDDVVFASLGVTLEEHEHSFDFLKVLVEFRDEGVELGPNSDSNFLRVV